MTGKDGDGDGPVAITASGGEGGYRTGCLVLVPLGELCSSEVETTRLGGILQGTGGWIPGRAPEISRLGGAMP